MVISHCKLGRDAARAILDFILEKFLECLQDVLLAPMTDPYTSFQNVMGAVAPPTKIIYAWPFTLKFISKKGSSQLP